MTISQINTKSRSLADADSTSWTDANLLIDTNANIEKLVSMIIQNCKNFPYDDENFANIAEGTILLEEGVSKYTITDKFLDILELKVKDTSGYWNILTPKTQKEMDSVVETLEATTGLPTQYRAVGRTIFLAPAPGAAYVTLTAGLLFKYTRTSYQITSADVTTGTLVPGLASPWHITICKMNALDYCSLYKKDRVALLQAQINDDIYGQYGLLDFYNNRLKDRKSRLEIISEDVE